MSKVSGTFLTEAPLVGSWPLGWSELPCVCVFQLGLAEIDVVNRTYEVFSFQFLKFLEEIGFHLWAGEARQGTVGVRGRPEDLLEPGV